MGIFERWLTLWVALCIVAGVLVGQVNLPVGLLIWVIPMLLPADQLDR